MTAAPPAEFGAHWQALKTYFDTDAPRWIARFFAALPPPDRALIERLVLEGKSARGCLTCLVCEALGGTLSRALPRAVAIECIQAASLVHDDFIDSDAIRRERPALWTTLGPRRAVLLGDLMFATALAQGARLSLADVQTLAEAIATVAAGAYQEPLDTHELATREASQPGARTLYERVIHCKTGALFGAAGKLGAIAAGAEVQHVAAAYAFATRIGEAYQMADDAQDLLGAPDGRGSPAQKAAALATLRAHFAIGESTLSASPVQRNAHGVSPHAESEAELRPRLREEVDRRLKLARRELSGFPAGLTGALLHAAPAFIVNLQALRA